MDSRAEACILSLIGAKILSESDADRAKRAARGGESPLAAARRLGLLPDEIAARAAADALCLPYLDAVSLAALPAPPVTGAPQPAFIAAHRLAIAPGAGGGLLAVLSDPFDQPLRSAIEIAAEGPVTFAVASEAGIDAWRAARAKPTPPPASTASDTASGAAVEVLEALLERAARRKASDLHFEPTPGGGRARARIDGQMTEIGTLDATTYPAAIARAKVLARLDVAERRLPQDGRAQMQLAGRVIDLRLSTAPAMGGETLALRLLDPAGAPGDLSALGFSADYVDVLERASRAPHGLFLLTGPTGSGKTTTLHAALSGLSDAATKIMTVEDPVEYILSGAVQMQVRADIGFDFARAQRAMLRHNPDVMMVGEIRDGESAAIAVQAALTGHLVLSTVHANSAAGAAIRLLDLGVEPFLVSAALIGAGAQRLARRLCPDCAVPDTPSPAALARIGAPTGGAWRRAAGCTACAGTGIRGRVPVAEAFLASRAYLDAVRSPAPDEATLAPLTGTERLSDAALQLAAKGIISLDEALRIAPGASAS